MGLVGIHSEPFLPVGFVIAEVTLPPADLGIPLEGQHMGGDPVEKPSIVTDDHRTTRKPEQRLLEGTKGIDVEVVGRLVEEQYVATALENRCQETSCLA